MTDVKVAQGAGSDTLLSVASDRRYDKETQHITDVNALMILDLMLQELREIRLLLEQSTVG